MFNKSLAFGLLAAGLMVAPTGAFAGQGNSQRIEQIGTARDGSTVVNDAKQSAHNDNTRVNTSNRYGKRYGNRSCYTSRRFSTQNNDQFIGQDGNAKHGSTVANVAKQHASNSNTDATVCN